MSDFRLAKGAELDIRDGLYAISMRCGAASGVTS